jgi:hypothetical protein
MRKAREVCGKNYLNRSDEPVLQHFLSNSFLVVLQYACTNGACVSWFSVCNGLDDCGDFSDEYSCNKNECQHPNACAHECVEKDVGFECRCHEGFVPQAEDPTR